MNADLRPGSRRRARVGIRDVAAAAGVSITTVSDALNGKGRIPDTTREHVRQTAERLGYRPSAAARTLRTGRSGLLGLTTGLFAGPNTSAADVDAFAELARAATEAAHDRGYSLVILPSTKQRGLCRSVALDGIVLLDPTAAHPVVAEFAHQDIPVVISGTPEQATEVHGWVTHDHEAATHRVLDHLWEQGARSIGLLVAASPGGGPADGWSAMYSAWCEHRGQPPLIEQFVTEHGSAEAAAERLLSRRDRPDAVYGPHHTCGSDVLAAARRLGLAVPEDLMVACLSDSAAYTRSEPPVTTLSLLPRASAEAAVEMLVDVIEARDGGTTLPHPQARVVPTRLEVRASTQR